ncbi:hypothetical protein PBOR_18855 [Paenibacillus borealis]|uniref:Uncharacterized protein n=1 Tax=Paenibacillus borealis TaxID=160799 RepID=A0A089LB88_PAEBO|nr:hypothetical protein PBOR_18855 [Paenibacillus borealis]
MKAVLDNQRNHVGIKRRNMFWIRIKRDATLYALLLMPILYIAIFKYAPIYGVIPCPSSAPLRAAVSAWLR